MSDLPPPSSQPEFWDSRYRTGRPPWDAGGVPRAFEEFLQREPGPGRAFIPGCGYGYEVRALHAHGWTPTALDFSTVAVARARALLGDLGGHVQHGDVFAFSPPAPFDLVYERTFLCALPPERWPDYVDTVHRLLGPRGRLAGIFFYGQDFDPPPFPIDPATADRLFSPRFERLEDRSIPADQSLPVYDGAERWQVWRKRG